MRDFYTKENMQGAAFHVPDGGLSFEPAELSFETETETGREGVIRVRHSGGKPARGYVYASERCMRGVREQFAPAADGTGYIRWQFDSRGIAPGRTVSGFFRVISPFGEYSIPYTVRVSGAGEISKKKSIQGRAAAGTAGTRNLQGNTPAARISRRQGAAQEPQQQSDSVQAADQDLSFSDIRTKADFLALAEENIERAADFFYSHRLYRILTEDQDRTLYRGLSMQKDNLQNVEEFLIAACGKKKTIFEPVETSLFLQTEGKGGRVDSRLAGSRAERALEAHRQRVRSRGMGVAAAKQQPAQEDLVYIPLQIRKIGTGQVRLTIQAEGRFLPSAPFDVPAELQGSQDSAAGSAKTVDAAKRDVSAARDVSAETDGSAKTDDGAKTDDSVKTDGSAKKDASAKTDGDDYAEAAPVRESDQSHIPVFGKARTGEPELLFTVRIPVSRAALHAGRNFGSVTVRGPFNETVVPVEVYCLPVVPPVRRRQERELHLLELQLMRLYVDFRLTDSRAHADIENQADRLIEEITRRSRRDLIPRLYRVHMMILRGKNAEAERELSRIAVRYAGVDSAQNISARFTAEQDAAYVYRQYLYARCRLEDTQLRSRVVRFLKGVYRAQADWQTAWMLMDLAEEYAPGTSARWNFLRHQFENGCNSPVIWIDAWEMVREDPGILLPGSSVQERWVKDEFGLLVLWYAARNNILTADAAEVMISLAEKKKNFSLLLYRALCASVEVEALADMKSQLLRAICILLIRGQYTTPQACVWYTRALEESVSLTNLEEYRQRSIPADDSEFRLPAGCNAILRTTAARARRAVLLYDRFSQEQVFPIRDGVAPMSVYGDANTIFLEDSEGNRHAVTLPFAVDQQEKEPDDPAGQADLFAVRQTDQFSVRHGDKIPGRKAGQADLMPASVFAGRAPEKRMAFSDNPYELALQIGYGNRKKELSLLTPDTAAAAGRLLDSGLMTSAARTELLLLCLSGCGQLPAESSRKAEESSGAGGRGNTKPSGSGVRGYTESSGAGGRGNTKPSGAGGRGNAESAPAVRASSGHGGTRKPADLDSPDLSKNEMTRFFLQKADPAQCSSRERALLLRYLQEDGEYERAVTWLLAYGNDAVDARLLGRICLGLPWENGYETAVVPIGWEAFLRGNTDPALLEKLSACLQGLSVELCRLRKACVDGAVPTRDLDNRIVRQTLFSGAVSQEHAQIIVSEGERLGEAFLPAMAQYADFAFSGGISMGIRMTDLVAKTIAEGREETEDICKIACLKELSMRQGDFSGRERDAAVASLSSLLSKGIIFPFYRQFPGYDDRLDLYAEETLVQYHSPGDAGEDQKHILFHYTTSRRGETGNYRSRPMKEMYRNFFVSGFLLFYGEQMHYYITDDPQEKHVVQSGMIGQDARILENCSGRFGLINETTRAAALRDYDEALALLTGYYRRSYLENELFRR